MLFSLPQVRASGAPATCPLTLEASLKDGEPIKVLLRLAVAEDLPTASRLLGVCMCLHAELSDFEGGVQRVVCP